VIDEGLRFKDENRSEISDSDPVIVDPEIMMKKFLLSPNWA